MDGGLLVYYKPTLWAFGSDELITKNRYLLFYWKPLISWDETSILSRVQSTHIILTPSRLIQHIYIFFNLSMYYYFQRLWYFATSLEPIPKTDVQPNAMRTPLHDQWKVFISQHLIIGLTWKSDRYEMSHIMRKPVFTICKQQRHRSACAFT